MFAGLDCHQEYGENSALYPATSLSGTDGGGNFWSDLVAKEIFFVLLSRSSGCHRDFWGFFLGIYFRAILGETENAEKRPSNPEPTAIDGGWGEGKLLSRLTEELPFEKTRDVGVKSGASPFFQVNLPGRFGNGDVFLGPETAPEDYEEGITHSLETGSVYIYIYFFFPGFLHANYPHFVVLVGW